MHLRYAQVHNYKLRCECGLLKIVKIAGAYAHIVYNDDYSKECVIPLSNIKQPIRTPNLEDVSNTDSETHRQESSTIKATSLIPNNATKKPIKTNPLFVRKIQSCMPCFPSLVKRNEVNNYNGKRARAISNVAILHIIQHILLTMCVALLCLFGSIEEVFKCRVIMRSFILCHFIELYYKLSKFIIFCIRWTGFKSKHFGHCIRFIAAIALNVIDLEIVPFLIFNSAYCIYAGYSLHAVFICHVTTYLNNLQNNPIPGTMIANDFIGKEENAWLLAESTVIGVLFAHICSAQLINPILMTVVTITTIEVFLKFRASSSKSLSRKRICVSKLTEINLLPLLWITPSFMIVKQNPPIIKFSNFLLTIILTGLGWILRSISEILVNSTTLIGNRTKLAIRSYVHSLSFFAVCFSTGYNPTALCVSALKCIVELVIEINQN
ncbi:hypothetical protein GJ496_011021 [Pomphorhynchus laevis]|nr:hypothetical protein GJ496_011021 [Pomphorhynchus laevis]